MTMFDGEFWISDFKRLHGLYPGASYRTIKPAFTVFRYARVTATVSDGSVRADKWIQAAGPADIIKAVPESYLLGDRTVYIDAFLASKGALLPDGVIPPEGAATAGRALQSVDDSLQGAHFDLSAVWSNEFAVRADAKKA